MITKSAQSGTKVEEHVYKALVVYKSDTSRNMSFAALYGHKSNPSRGCRAVITLD
jgi:hypothetical protein